MIAIFDIEANGLYQEATEIHCISIKVDDKPTLVYTSNIAMPGSNGTLEEGIELLNTASLVVGHNIINYDIPTLDKLGFKVTAPVRDTLLMSKLAYPDLMMLDANRKTIPSKLKGKHSLKAWGYRLRLLKGEFEESWERLTPEMIEYCRQDSEVTYALYNKLLTRNIPEEAIKLEQEFAKIISRQEKYGVFFDTEKARKLHVELVEDLEGMEKKLEKTFKPLKTWISGRYPKNPYNKNGDKSVVLKAQEAKGYHYNEEGCWGYYTEVAFNPSSRQQIARWLSEVYGWKPTEYTDKGSVIINEKVLESLSFPEGKLLAHYFNVKKLIGQLAEGKNAWLVKVEKDGRVRGRVDTLGAVSRRCIYSNPNVAQVPSSRSYKGAEARALFTVPKGKKLVGCDADGLELRTLSHYMARYDGGKYGQVVDKGDKEAGTDIHTLNQKSVGLSSRDDAKTFIYAFIYGGGDAMLGGIVGGGAEVGKKFRTKFLKKLPAIKMLIEAVAKAYKENGTLRALDGNPYHVRSSHSALNTLLQGAGALVMKYYLILLDSVLQKKFTVGSQYEFVLNVVDEVQIECDEDIAETVAKIAEESFDAVTELLSFRVPLRGSAAIGDSWAETH